LSETGNLLGIFERRIDPESFRPVLGKTLDYASGSKGQPSYDRAVMF